MRLPFSILSTDHARWPRPPACGDDEDAFSGDIWNMCFDIGDDIGDDDTTLPVPAC